MLHCRIAEPYFAIQIWGGAAETPVLVVTVSASIAMNAEVRSIGNPSSEGSSPFIQSPYQAGRSKHWIKIKNRKHPAMNRVTESLG
jgi:hypothetical protein